MDYIVIFLISLIASLLVGRITLSYLLMREVQRKNRLLDLSIIASREVIEKGLSGTHRDLIELSDKIFEVWTGFDG